MHQEITMYDELMRRLDHVTLKLREYKTKNQELEARLRAAEDRDRPAASPPPPAPLPIFNVEVEAWIRHIENVAKPATDATFISAARASCKGPADLIVNSPMFDGIREWAIFKTLLRRKFRGTCSSTDFFTILNECRMTTTQGPQDFFQQLEGIVYQGVRDYPDVVGNPEPLLKRLFLQGLPLWLREYLAIIDELPLDRLVETAQRIWNTRTGVARTEPLADRHPPRPLRAVAPVEEPPEHRRTRWCSYHRTSRHDNTECRYRPRRLACFRCQQEGHLVKDCPFPPPSDGSAPVAGGTRWGQPLQYPRSSDTGAIARNSLNPHLQPTSRTTDGDILIGIDLLKRLDFRLGYDSRTNNSYLRLRGKAFTVRYVNKDSLELTAVVMKMKGMSVPVPPARAAVPVRVPDALIGKQLLVEGLGYSVILPREVIKPSSKEAVVWVVNPTLNPVKLRNGTHLVELHEVEEMCDTPEAPGNVASIADTPVAAVPTSALEKISLKHLSDHRDKFAIGEVPDIVHEIPTQEKHPLCQRQWRLPEAAKRHIPAQEASRKARQEYAAYHNRNLRPPWSLEAGSLVLYKIKTTQTGPDRALGPRWQGPAKVVKKLGPVNYVVQDLSPPFSERNCHANQLRPFKLEEELTFPDASPYHDPDYVDPWLPDDAEPGATMLLSAIRPSQHAPQSW
ncbi:hypothetical protein C7M84_017200 [Penaeus vannamei]|uniref:CCHC-type domain-containing protein n=1 Tax=Penaeus vannamei TaxID=6689 RepID=A0A3R7QEI4_PENVA|nr:hypothetical protein C7M84_017200 [Penaeus vannamei]